jgi:hypothetical protein
MNHFSAGIFEDRLAFRVASGSSPASFYGRLAQDGQALDAYSDEVEPTTLRRTS